MCVCVCAVAWLQLDPGSNATRCGTSSGAVTVAAAAVLVSAGVANEIFLQLVYFHTNDFDFRSDAQPNPPLFVVIVVAAFPASFC